jgi:hypothetical protein
MFKSRSAAKSLGLASGFLIVLPVAELSTSSRAADATFIRVGFLPGDDSSRVLGVDDAGTLAACASFHFENNVRVYKYAALWTPVDGIQALPRLPNTVSGSRATYAIGGRDLTADGSRIAFTAPTLDQTRVAAGISDPDGGNLIAITSLPNGSLMPAISQLSDDAQTAFGYQSVSGYQEGAMWTAAGGVTALVPPTGYTNVAPAGGRNFQRRQRQRENSVRRRSAELLRHHRASLSMDFGNRSRWAGLSAILATLEPGAYTAVVRGQDGGTGVGLVEAHDLDVAAASKLANISTPVPWILEITF